MATGYTAAVCSGEMVDLRSFVLSCARAFDVRTKEGGEVNTAPTPLDVSDEDEAIKSAKAELRALLKLPVAEMRRRAKEEFEAALVSHAQSQADRAETKARYLAMREKVAAWKVDPVLLRLKRFMLKQIDESIEFDCYRWAKPRRRSATKWFDERVAALEHRIKFNQERRREAVQRHKRGNKWLAALAACVPPAPPTAVRKTA
jgi:hypothetical protein